jgi:hypothetical protein
MSFEKLPLACRDSISRKSVFAHRVSQIVFCAGEVALEEDLSVRLHLCVVSALSQPVDGRLIEQKRLTRRRLARLSGRMRKRLVAADK